MRSLHSDSSQPESWSYKRAFTLSFFFFLEDLHSQLSCLPTTTIVINDHMSPFFFF